MNRRYLYALANVAFALIVMTGSIIGSGAVHPLYLVLLFAICTTPVLDMRRLNDRFVLLALFSLIYFVFYGFGDLSNLLASGHESVPGVLSEAELTILLGGALAHLFYRAACRPTDEARIAKDWSESSLLWAGGILWAVCTWLTWDFKVNIVVNTSNDAVARGLGSLGALQSAGYILGAMLQPLGILIIAYAQRLYPRNHLTILLIVVVLVQLVMGFVIDVKGLALLGGAIAIATRLLIDGNLPKAWLAVMAVFIALAFPVLQANRTVRDQYSVNRNDVAANLLKTVERAVDISKRAPVSAEERSLSFLERMSMKASVDMIVTQTGKGVAFQNGHTLSPLLTAFIPRLIWRDKPDVQTGQLVNSEFKVSEFADTYISPSHLGELYWNFGWAGVVIGMSLTGLLLGFVGSRNDLTAAVTLTRVMILGITFQLLILGAESSIAAQYVVWLRSMAAIGLLHLFMARVPVLAGRSSTDVGQPARVERPSTSAPAYPNLMR